MIVNAILIFIVLFACIWTILVLAANSRGVSHDEVNIVFIYTGKISFAMTIVIFILTQIIP